MPGANINQAEERAIVATKDGRLIVVGGVDYPVDVKGGDGVTAKAAGGGRMEEFGVFIAFKGKLDFGAGFPVGGALPDRKVKVVHGERPKAVFPEGQRAGLFQEIQEVDEEAAIPLPFLRWQSSPSPTFAATAAQLKTRHDLGGRVRTGGGGPRNRNRETETVMQSPGRFIAEEATFGDRGGDGGDKRNMIRGVAG
jgi:hypothetical protein